MCVFSLNSFSFIPHYLRQCRASDEYLVTPVGRPFCQVAFQISDDEKEDCAVDWSKDDDIADFLNFNNFFESSEVSSIQFVAMRIRVDSEPWDNCVQLLELMMTEMWTRFSLQLSLVEKIVLSTS